MSEIFDEGAYDYPMYKTAGDSLAMTIDYAESIAGQTFEAGITENGVLIQAITCTATDEATGTLVLTLSSSLTAALAGRNLRWYYSRTISGTKRTELAGVSAWARK